MEPMPEDWESAVAVVAHPDHIEYGVAAAVARWTGQGKKVTYVLATKGEAGIAGMAPAEVGPLRMEEERRSAEVVGVHQVTFLDHPDGLVEYGIALRRDLATQFRRLRRDHHHRELRPDLGRRGTGQPRRPSCGRARRAGRVPGRRERVGVSRGRVAVGIRAAYVATIANPTHFVDVTATIDAGIASLREHQAYIDGLGTDFDPDEFLRNMAGYVGMGGRMRICGRLPPLSDGLNANEAPPCMRWRGLVGPRRPGLTVAWLPGATSRPPGPDARRNRFPDISRVPGLPRVVPVSNGEYIFTASASTARAWANYFLSSRYPHSFHRIARVFRMSRSLSTE